MALFDDVRHRFRFGADAARQGGAARRTRVGATALALLLPVVRAAAIVGLGGAPGPLGATALAASAPATASAPAPKPSNLAIDDESGVANVSGAVTDGTTRDAILAALRAAYGPGNVKGDITVDPARAPTPWLANLPGALEYLKIPGVAAQFQDAEVKLGGPLSYGDRVRVATGIRSALGAGVIVTAAPAAPAPAAAPAAVAATRPATLTIDNQSGVATVSGATHDDATRAAVIAAVKGAFGVGNVKGDIAVDPARAEAPWLANLSGALEYLKIPGLAAEFQNSQVKLAGALSYGDRERIATGIRSALGAGVTVAAAPAPAPSAAAAAPAAPAPAPAAARQAAPEPGTPATLVIDQERGVGVASISGAVRDAETRAAILAALKTAFGPDNVKGDLVVDPARAAPPWLASLPAALVAVHVPGLKAAFDGATVKVGGVLPSTGRLDAAASLGLIYGAVLKVGGDAAP